MKDAAAEDDTLFSRRSQDIPLPAYSAIDPNPEDEDDELPARERRIGYSDMSLRGSGIGQRPKYDEATVRSTRLSEWLSD